MSNLKTNLAASLARLGDAQNTTYQAGMKTARTSPKPPVGIHACVIEDVNGNEYTDKKTGQEYLNIEVTLKVQDGPAAGFTFAHTFWGNSERDMGALLDVASLAAGEAFSSYNEAVTALCGATGSVVNVKINEYQVKGQPGVTKKGVSFIG